ncbi:MAG TPA: hypothetical protein VK502_02115 [Candidatus Saccharimonadales bacterium]|nr:hypothetical protein [Candidatus Saccharimonadales bacterium]
MSDDKRIRLRRKQWELKFAELIGNSSMGVGTIFCMITIFSNALSPEGIGMVILGYLIERTANTKMRKRLRRHRPLFDQTPTKISLLSQLEPGQVVVGHYDSKGSPMSTIVAMHDSVRMQRLIRDGEAMELAEAIKAADNHEVFFTAGPE